MQGSAQAKSKLGHLFVEHRTEMREHINEIAQLLP